MHANEAGTTEECVLATSTTTYSTPYTMWGNMEKLAFYNKLYSIM